MDINNHTWSSRVGGDSLIEKLRFTFTPNGKREFVPRDQVFSLIVVYYLLLLLKNKWFLRQFYP